MMNSTSSLFIATPTPLDVLCSQNAKCGQHEGNKLLRRLIDQTVAAYQQARDRQEKIAKIDGIVAIMRAKYNSRFLRERKKGAECGWEEICEQSARDKVSHALRFAARRLPKQQRILNHEQQQDHESTKASSCTMFYAQSAEHVLDVPQDPFQGNFDDSETTDGPFLNHVNAIHQRQQVILKRMLEEARNESNESCSVFANSSTSWPPETGVSSVAEKIPKEIETLDPLPLEPNFKSSQGHAGQKRGRACPCESLGEEMLQKEIASIEPIPLEPKKRPKCPQDQKNKVLDNNTSYKRMLAVSHTQHRQGILCTVDEPCGMASRPRYALRGEHNFDRDTPQDFPSHSSFVLPQCSSCSSFNAATDASSWPQPRSYLPLPPPLFPSHCHSPF